MHFQNPDSFYQMEVRLNQSFELAYSRQNKENQSKVPSHVYLLNCLQRFICLQRRQLALLTVEHIPPLKFSFLNTFALKIHAEHEYQHRSPTSTLMNLFHGR